MILLKKLPSSVLVLMAFFLQCQLAWAASITWQESRPVCKELADAGVEGTFVVYLGDTGEYIGCHQKRAATQYAPGSTFKIPHTLIGLVSGAVRSVDTVLPYGGEKQENQAWEHDMSLREAIKISNVPIYQELARRIGSSRMQKQLRHLHYGNEQMGTELERFWLEGPLAISAIEQVQFLFRLAKSYLPVPAIMQEAVANVLLQENRDGWKLYGKTGAVRLAHGQYLGWYVGWVRHEDSLYTFALNMKMPQMTDDILALRVSLAKRCLEHVHALPRIRDVLEGY